MPVLSHTLLHLFKTKKQLAWPCHSMACGNLRGVYHKKHCKDNNRLINEKKQPTAPWWVDTLGKNLTFTHFLQGTSHFACSDTESGLAVPCYCIAKPTCSTNTACATSLLSRQWRSQSFQRGHTILPSLKSICRWLTQIIFQHKCKTKILLIQGCIISGLSAFIALPLRTEDTTK